MNMALKLRSGAGVQDSVTMRLVKPRMRKERIPQMKTVLRAAAAFGLLLAASASNPAAAAETYHRGAPNSAAPVAGTPGASDLGGIIYVDDDQEYDNHYYGNQPDPRYSQWPYPQQNNNWPYPQTNNYGSQNGPYQGDSEKGWRDRNWNNNWNYQYAQRQPLPGNVIIHKLRQQHFYNVQKIKAKKGYYKVYAFDRDRRPVSVIVDPYTGRILRVGPR
jgi:hypothetical protein